MFPDASMRSSDTFAYLVAAVAPSRGLQDFLSKPS